jgi:NADP-dependent 3-hydroxy acid dehydrogenase YdfG
MGHLLKIKCVDSRVNVHILSSTVYLFQTEVPFCMQAFLPAMIEKKAGHVVNIASLAGHSGTNKLV